MAGFLVASVNLFGLYYLYELIIDRRKFFFQAFSQHLVLSTSFLEHVITVFSQTSIINGDLDRIEDSHVDSQKDGMLQAAILALTAFFRFVLLAMFN